MDRYVDCILSSAQPGWCLAWGEKQQDGGMGAVFLVQDDHYWWPSRWRWPWWPAWWIRWSPPWWTWSWWPTWWMSWSCLMSVHVWWALRSPPWWASSWWPCCRCWACWWGGPCGPGWCRGGEAALLWGLLVHVRLELEFRRNDTVHNTCNLPTFLCPLVNKETILRPR